MLVVIYKVQGTDTAEWEGLRYAITRLYYHIIQYVVNTQLKNAAGHIIVTQFLVIRSQVNYTLYSPKCACVVWCKTCGMVQIWMLSQ